MGAYNNTVLSQGLKTNQGKNLLLLAHIIYIAPKAKKL